MGQGYELPLPAQGVKHIALVGGGYGVAPLLFLAQEAQVRGLQASVIIGARTAASLLLVEDFAALGLSPLVTTEDGSVGQRGRVTDALRLLLAGSVERPQAVFTCGPVGMLQAVAEMAGQENLPIQLGWEATCAVGLVSVAVAKWGRVG
ncbi:MAG: hypothetical protein HC875_35620 [Anaerolineales bacterium]|nr:hypothetical protein [Anaerolineales bacterium]